MVEFDDMTPDERDRFVYLLLSEQDLKAIVLIMRKRYGPEVTTDQIMRFAFKVARNKMIPADIRNKFKNKDKSKTDTGEIPENAKIFKKLFKP